MIGQRLTELRKQHKWSLQHVADYLGIAKSTYAGYESGYREPSLEMTQKLADLFEVSMDELFLRPSVEHSQADAAPRVQDEEWMDPELGVWFKELLEAPQERREELRKIWEIIKSREEGRKAGDKQGE